MAIDYDNKRDQFQHGFDAGLIIDGIVTLDPNTQRFVLVDEDNKGLDLQVALQHLDGKRIRLTIVSFETMEALESMLNATRSPVES
jgi:hypothetical protein